MYRPWGNFSPKLFDGSMGAGSSRPESNVSNALAKGALPNIQLGRPIRPEAGNKVRYNAEAHHRSNTKYLTNPPTERHPTSIVDRRGGSPIRGHSCPRPSSFGISLRTCVVDTKNCGQSSHLTSGVKLLLGQTVEKMDGTFLKITEIRKDDSGVISLHCVLLLSSSRAQGQLPERQNEVYWDYKTRDGRVEADGEENWVKLQDIKQVRQLSMGSQSSANPGRFDSQPFEQESAIRALPALICRWKLTTVLKEEDPQRPRIQNLGNVKWLERCFSSLDADTSDMASTDSYGNCTVEVIGTHPERMPDRLPLLGVGSYTFGDVYCGAGGVSRGAEQAGLHVIWALERDQHAVLAYRESSPFTHVDHTFDYSFLAQPSQQRLRSKVDVVHLSPPCHPFAANHTVEGANDEENRSCLARVKQLLSDICPRVATVENVPTLMRGAKHTKYFNNLIGSFTTLGYSVRWKIIDCVDDGVPQRRKRLWIVASRPGEPPPSFPAATHGDVGPIVALPNKQNTLKPFQTISDAINDIPLDNPDHVLILDNPGDSFLRKAYRADTTLDATITTSGTKHHPLGRRHFTTRELASIQVFPLDHRFEGSKTERSSK